MKLRDIWISECVNQGGTTRVNADSWLSKVARDIIGLNGAFAQGGGGTGIPRRR
jgi:hypothetical protein